MKSARRILFALFLFSLNVSATDLNPIWEIADARTGKTIESMHATLWMKASMNGGVKQLEMR